MNDDPRIEAQPLHVAGVHTPYGVHKLLYVCTMANNVWAFDAGMGQTAWGPVNLGRPIKPQGSEIDIFEINILWGILGTPGIDHETERMYVACWMSRNGSVDKAVHQFHALDIATGSRPTRRSSSPPMPARRAQRAALLLTRVADGGGHVRKTVFAAFSATHDEHDPSHGWIVACDVDQFSQTGA